MANPAEALITGVKNHPYITVGAIAAAVVVGFIWSSGSDSGGQVVTTQGGYDPALLQLASQELQGDQQLAVLNAQSTANNANLEAQIRGLQIQTAAQLALGTLQLQNEGQANQYAFQLGSLNLQVATHQAELQAGIANNSINTQRLVQLAQIDSNNITASLNAQTAISITTLNTALQERIANYATQLQTTISNNQTRVSLAQTKAAVQIAGANAQASIFGGLFGLVGKLF